jgi:cobalt-zinc-cadmium efflux system protein
MSHVQKPLLVATGLNTAVFVVEGVAGFQGHSLSLLADATHNLSDELALVCLALGYLLPIQLSRHLQRSANALNSVGLLLVSAVIAWQAFERTLNPAPVASLLPITIGLLGAVGNWGVARALRPFWHVSPAIRLDYLHNVGDVWVSLAPVVAGVLVALSGWGGFDALIGAGLALWIIWGTVQELQSSSSTLLWPDDAVCEHPAVESRAAA